MIDVPRTSARRILAYTVRNQLRGRAIPGYALFFVVVTFGLLHFGGGINRALPSLASLILLVVPLVSLVVGTVGFYDGREFTELLLSHPVARGPLFTALYLGLVLPLAAAFALGMGLPLAFGGLDSATILPAALVLLGGVLLTAVFGALAVLVATSVQDAARGLGVALLVWLGLTVMYDGVVLLGTQAFSSYPLERPLLVAMLLNPVDLARVLVLVAMDAPALLGYTGAVFQKFFGSVTGVVVATASLGLWIALPTWAALRRFRRMDF